jgi:outer membrane biosynthesis protein TonB
MRTALVVFLSLLLHVGIVFAGLVYFPESARQFATTQIVPLELVTEIAAQTNLPQEIIEEEVIEEEAPPPAPEPEPEPEPPAPAPEPEIDNSAVPEQIPTPEPEPVVEPIPEPEQVASQQPRREAPQPTQSSQADSFDALLNDLAGSIDEERSNAPSGQARQGASSHEAIGVTLADSIRSQAQRCFRSSIDAPNPERLLVRVRVRLNRDGSLDGRPEALNEQAISLSDNRYWRVARDRALAAIIDCAPYRLPAEYYSIWRRIDVTFRSET